MKRQTKQNKKLLNMAKKEKTANTQENKEATLVKIF